MGAEKNVFKPEGVPHRTDIFNLKYFVARIVALILCFPIQGPVQF